VITEVTQSNAQGGGGQQPATNNYLDAEQLVSHLEARAQQYRKGLAELERERFQIEGERRQLAEMLRAVEQREAAARGELNEVEYWIHLIRTSRPAAAGTAEGQS
jgi:predicted component of type VI protein secretion system